jgi:hypothetical protein
VTTTVTTCKPPKSPASRRALNNVATAAIRSLAPSEAAIEQTCTEWLALDGWRSLKTDPVSRKEWGKGFGELGMADRLYIRYEPRREHYPLHPCTNVEFFNGSRAEVLWIEWKRIKGKLATKATTDQWEWHRLERLRGALTLIAGLEFPASIEGFQTFYRASGLMRRKI